MKLSVDQDRQVNLNGLKVKNYGIGNIAVFQQVARSSMYSDPYRACIQEYLSNGIDAMRERRRVDPSFEPNRSKLTVNFNGGELHISDCGIGISPERMEKGFASYYGSSKRGSDDEIGGFGLGCKTAFADPNRDSFTVDTVYDDENGIRRRYVTYHFIDSNGLTSYAELSNVESPESDLGTTIILPIDESDVDTYKNVITRVCKHWADKPTIRGINLEWPSVPELFKGDNWIVTDAGVMEVVIDGIPYEVDSHKLPLEHRELAKSGMVLFFNTGDLSITSTRESLDYRGDTVARIVDLVNDIKDEVSGKVSSMIDGMNLWQAQKYLKSVRVFVSEDKIPQSVLAQRIYFHNLSVFSVRNDYGSISVSDERHDLDYSAEFTVLFTRTKTVSKGRLRSFLDSDKHKKGNNVYVMRVPNYLLHKNVKYDFTGPDGFTKFINFIDSSYPGSRFKEVVSEAYDLQSWPIHEDYREHKVRKKFTKSALICSDRGKWSNIEADRMESLKLRKNVYYIIERDLKVLRGKRCDLDDSVTKDAIFISLDEDQKDSVPDNWKPYWKTYKTRLQGKLERARTLVKEVNKMNPSDLASNFGCYNGFHSFILLGKLSFMQGFKSDGKKVEYLSLDRYFRILSCVNTNKPMSSVLLRSYRGPGGIYDKKARQNLIRDMRSKLLTHRMRAVTKLVSKIKSIKN